MLLAKAIIAVPKHCMNDISNQALKGEKLVERDEVIRISCFKGTRRVIKINFVTKMWNYMLRILSNITHFHVTPVTGKFSYVPAPMFKIKL